VVKALRRNPLALESLGILTVIGVAVLLVPVVMPYGPDESTPRFAAPPTLQNWFGTDNIGRDVLTRVLYGGRISLGIGFAAVFLGTGFGVLAGTISGYAGGATDMVLQRIVDILMAVPGLLMALTIVAAFGAGPQNVTIAIAIGIAPRTIRVVRASTLAVSALPYIEAAHSLGIRPPRLIWHHILPNIMAPVIVVASLQLGSAMIVEASLSYLGLGVPINVPTWGNMLSGAGLSNMVRAPWMAIAPGAALTVVVLALNLLGDSLRDMLDPKLRGQMNRSGNAGSSNP